MVLQQIVLQSAQIVLQENFWEYHWFLDKNIRYKEMGIFYKSVVVSFGSGSDGVLNVGSGVFTASGTKNYSNGNISAGAILVIPRNSDVRFSGTLINSGTITGGTADAAGTGATGDPTTPYELLPVSTNGATSTNSGTFLGRGSVRIFAKFFVNNGVVNTSGSASTSTDGYGYTSGINGNGAGSIFVISELVSGSGSMSMAGGAGETGHNSYTIPGTCTTETYYNYAGGKTCSYTPTSYCAHENSYNNIEGNKAPESGISYGTTDCPSTYGFLADGSSGQNSAAKIITPAPPTGGTTSSQTVTVVLSPFSAGSIIWFDKIESNNENRLNMQLN